jgi:hypothetical protein
MKVETSAKRHKVVVIYIDAVEGHALDEAPNIRVACFKKVIWVRVDHGTKSLESGYARR